jgi:hypothetical protein
MTEEERFRFDLAGFFVRPAILTADEVAAMTEHVDRVLHHWDSLPPEHRGLPSGPCTDLIDHPQVVDVLHEVIGPDVRLESAFAVWRHQGQDGGQPLHQGGRLQADPIFGYRVQEGRIFAGMVRVVFELTDVSKDDGATSFLVGSHKANFPVPPEHMGLDPATRSPFLASYDCPAGSAVFFTENLLHAGVPWQRPAPRVAVLHAYSHLATRFHRNNLSPEVVAAWTPEQQAYYREPWMYDFGLGGATPNSVERFIAGLRPGPTP